MVDPIKMATNRKHLEVTLKVKHEALKELEKDRPNKVVGSTFATWKKNKEKFFGAFQNSLLKQ